MFGAPENCESERIGVVHIPYKILIEKLLKNHPKEKTLIKLTTNCCGGVSMDVFDLHCFLVVYLSIFPATPGDLSALATMENEVFIVKGLEKPKPTSFKWMDMMISQPMFNNITYVKISTQPIENSCIYIYIHIPGKPSVLFLSQ